MFVYFVRAHVCLSVSVDVAFYFKLGFGRDEGLSLYLDFGARGFESVSWFWGTWVSSLYLDFGGRGFESAPWFWGTWVRVCILILGDVGFSLDLVFWGGECLFKIGFCLGVGLVLLWVLRGLFFLKGIIFVNFCFVLRWNFINICLTFTHSFSQFFSMYCGEV